jgi:regulator of replication initiation timing
MSTPSNFNQPTPTTPYGSSNNNNDGQKRMLTLAGIAIALLLGTTVYLAVTKYKQGSELASLEMNFDQQTKALAEVETRFADVTAQLTAEQGKNTELDAKIQEQLAELDKSKAEIQQLIRDKKDYRNKLAGLEAKTQQYLAEINTLKQQVGILTEQNTQLTTTNQQLNTDLTTTKSELDQTNQAKAALISEKTTLETENTRLGKKADRGSAIDVKTFDIKTLSVSGSGKEKEKSKAKKVDKVSLCFTTEANEVTDAGEETFYLIIIDPTGAPLLNDALGSGVSKDKKAESDFRFTTTATTNYQNSETNVCGAWNPGANFIAGKYTVEVWNKGYKVGTSSFNLKKGLF